VRPTVTRRLPLFVVFVTIVTLFRAGTAFGQPACTQFAPDFAALVQQIGAVMGVPSSCPRVDGDGNTIQLSSTGLALRRPDGMLVFASGDEHWALSSAGLQAWTGNWHNGLYPPVTPQSDGNGDATQVVPGQQPDNARVRPMTLVQVLQDGSNSVVVEDPSGSMFMVQTADGCPDVDTAVGDHVFVRSGGSQTDLILMQQHETCAVATMHTAQD
jgi:hypothetical protein